MSFHIRRPGRRAAAVFFAGCALAATTAGPAFATTCQNSQGQNSQGSHSSTNQNSQGNDQQ